VRKIHITNEESVQKPTGFYVCILNIYSIGYSRRLSNISSESFEGSQDPNWVRWWLATPVNKAQGS
jgi:hypothetical protein